MNSLQKNKLIRLSVLILLFFQIALTLYSFKKNIPFEIQSLLAEDNSVRINYQKDLLNFNDENTNWIIFESPRALTAQEIYRISKKMGLNLEMNYGVESIIGPHNAKYFEVTPEGFALVPFIQNNEWTSRALVELKTDLWKNNLARDDFKAFLVSFKTTARLLRSDEKKVFDQIRGNLKEIEKQNPGIKTGLLGSKTASVYFLEEMQLQQRVITPVLLLLIILFFFFCFRSWQIVGWSLFVLFFCYTSTLCLIIFSEGGLGPYSSFALMFSFIVATTDLIQFFGRFQQLEGTNEERLNEALKISKFPCLLTSLTTAAGFLALVMNQNLPVRYFGLYCAFGCIIEWVLIYYLLPPLMKAFNFSAPRSNYDSEKMSQAFQRHLKKYSGSIALSTIAILILGAFFTTRLHIDDNFYTKFESKHPLSQALNLFSNGFDFVGSINVIIKKKIDSPNFYNLKLHSEISQIEKELLENPQVSRVSSLSQIYENLNQKTSLVSQNPKIAEEENESFLHILNNYSSLTDFYNEQQNEYRTTVFLRSMATRDLESVLSTINDVSKKYSDQFIIRPSGFSVIRDYINKQVIKDFFESFFVSFVLIFLCYYCLYRSVKWSFLALIPNAVPLLAVSGLMGLFQIPIDTNLVIVICVAFGISGDNTVHLTYVLQQEQLKGRTYDVALKNAYKLLGIAISATSAVFLFCLPVFTLGHLRLFDYIAIFLSAAFVVAFIADVFMFPHLQDRFGWFLHKKDLKK